MSTDTRGATDEEMLAYDPFAGDKDDGGARNYSRRVVTTSREHECLGHPDWFHIIPIGSRAVVNAYIMDGRWCRQYCCAVCIARWNDQWEAAK